MGTVKVYHQAWSAARGWGRPGLRLSTADHRIQVAREEEGAGEWAPLVHPVIGNKTKVRYLTL